MNAIETLRLRLEPLVEAHADAMFHGLRDPRLYDFIDERPPPSLESLQDRYRRLTSRRSPHLTEVWLNWALWSKRARKYVGWVQATLAGNQSAEIAYLLMSDQWGEGLAREAVAAMVTSLSKDHHIVLVTARVDTQNRRSVSLLEALGFRKIGAQRGSGGNTSEEAVYRLDLAAY